MKKEIICTICGSNYHYQTFCPQKPKKAIKVNKPLRASVTPLRQKTPIISSKPQKPLKRTKIRLQSKSERSVLVRKADRAFSAFIRRRYATNGLVRCVTCGLIGHWKSMDAGHFISRRKMAVRFEPHNVHVQCTRCNRELSGNLKSYESYMLSRYGRAEIDRLKQLALTGPKLTLDDLRKIADRYKQYLD